MYDIRQFKPALYILLFMGIGGFALAAESSGALVLGWTALLFNAWLVKTRRFQPIPRWTSNLILLAGVPWVLVQSRGGTMNDEVVWIGQYIVLLQIVKLYEQRGNRDYAQLTALLTDDIVKQALRDAERDFQIDRLKRCSFERIAHRNTPDALVAAARCNVKAAAQQDLWLLDQINSAKPH